MSHDKVGACRHPEKVRYYVKRHAMCAADRVSSQENKRMWVYPCGMHFHLTSKFRVDQTK